MNENEFDCISIGGALIWNCWTKKHCGEVVFSLPPIEFYFGNENIGDTAWKLTVPPEMYLVGDGKGGCETLVSSGQAPDSPIILGQPFFINTTVQLNYETKRITVYKKNTWSPWDVYSDGLIDAKDYRIKMVPLVICLSLMAFMFVVTVLIVVYMGRIDSALDEEY